MKPYTNAAELARLSGLTRQTIGNRLAKGEFPHAVRILHGDTPCWRIPVKDADRWLKAHGYAVPATWVQRGPTRGHVDEVWVGA